jgi:ribulose-phosphate 3-epimerase
MIKIAPSILSADFSRLGEDIQSVSSADYLHFDVMDGLFVPNISIGIPVLQSVRRFTDMTLDVHLMIDKPIRYIDAFFEAGADIINIHAEADTEENNLAALKKILSLGKRAAVTIKPGTPASELEKYIELCSLVLIMTVEPGFGGQKFMADMLPKLGKIRDCAEGFGLSCLLEGDGGINPMTAALAAAAGAEVLVAGSDVFGAADRAGRILALRGGKQA